MLLKKDLLILNSLKSNSRKSIKEISKETKIPRATVFDRLKKLKNEKVIKSFTVDLDHEKIGFGVLCFILIKFTSRANIPQVEVAKKISQLKGIEETYLISGGWDILIKVRAATIKELGDLILDKVRMIEGVAQTETCLVLK